MSEAIGLAISLAAAGLILVGISIPLILEKIPPNRWYGVKFPKTLADSQIWYEANKYSARDLLVVGCLLIFVGPALMLLAAKSLNPRQLTGLCVLLITIPTLIAVIRAVLYVRKL